MRRRPAGHRLKGLAHAGGNAACGAAVGDIVLEALDVLLGNVFKSFRKRLEIFTLDRALQRF
jgi:hypothetical protein